MYFKQVTKANKYSPLPGIIKNEKLTINKKKRAFDEEEKEIKLHILNFIYRTLLMLYSCFVFYYAAMVFLVLNAWFVI